MEKKISREDEEENRTSKRPQRTAKESRLDFGDYGDEFVSPGPFEPMWDGHS